MYDTGFVRSTSPRNNLKESINFYQKIGLEIAWKDEGIVFLWIDKKKSWLGLWNGTEYKTSYHPSIRHITFRVEYDFLKQSIEWLKSFS
jgi:hypothetical protein